MIQKHRWKAWPNLDNETQPSTIFLHVNSTKERHTSL